MLEAITVIKEMPSKLFSKPMGLWMTELLGATLGTN